MRVRIQKWGNSLALRIPKAYAREIGLAEKAEVEISVRQGVLVVAPLESPAYRLDELLANVTRRNRHGEVEFGRPAGREAW